MKTFNISIVSYRVLLCFLLPFVILYLSNSFLIFRGSLLSILICIIFLKMKAEFTISCKFALICLIVIVNFCVSLQIENLDKGLYLLVFLGLFTILPDITNDLVKDINLFKNSFKIVFWLSIIALIYLYIYSKEERFSGFSNSATTFSTYLLVMFALYIFISTFSISLLGAYLLVLFFVLESETRTSIGLFFVISFIRFFSSFVRKGLSLSFFLILGVSLGYYIFISFFEVYLTEIFNSRTSENGVDYSTFTRLSYFANQISALEGLNFKEILIGQGVSSSKLVGSTFEVEEIDQHNDFFTIFYDYGLIFFLLYMSFIKKLCTSPMSLALISIYFFSFYHNMAFDIFLIFAVFLSNKYYLQVNE